jgi:phosphatidate cytidylyltransferase
VLQRAVTGAVFASILISGYLYSETSSWALTSLIFILGFKEFSQITKESKGYIINPLFWISAITLILGFAPVLNDHQNIILGLNFVIIPLALISELFLKKKFPIESIGFGLLGLLYSSFIFFIFLSSFSTGRYNGIIAVSFYWLIWSNDTFAYLAGKYFGKRKLFERISPNKTWEGSLGGAVGTLIMAFILSIYLDQLTIIQWIILGVIAVIFGALGDLTQSLIKRNYEIKDSGNILPGHGGILDRFDAALMAAPILYFFITYFV